MAAPTRFGIVQRAAGGRYRRRFPAPHGLAQHRLRGPDAGAGALSPDLEPGGALNLLVLAMLACALVMFVGLQPAMAALREAAGPAGPVLANVDQFAVMHGVSQLFHLIESRAGGILVVKSR
jgi:hypothetical protein